MRCSQPDIRATVILSTCNAPGLLERTLAGYSRQVVDEFEIVIGEDGFTPSTLAVIQHARRAMGLAIQHVRQMHCGFRKPRALNRAIHASRGEYLIFSDGDCVPRDDFVAQHLAFAEPGRFLSGGRICLTRELTDNLQLSDILSGHINGANWLADRGMKLHRKWHWLATRPWAAAALDRLTTTRPTFNGHNSSAWKEDVVRVNGFDERMGYGGLDRELGERLQNLGVTGLQLGHRAVCTHLEHDRNYVSPDVIRRNQAIRRVTMQNKLTWTPHGLVQDAARADLKLREKFTEGFRRAA